MGNKPKEYAAWVRMRRRCRTSPYYRGIQISPRWGKYSAFLLDMGAAPTKDHTLGRIDNRHGYSKENCRWETWEQQANNKRGNTRCCAFGETKTIAQWSRDARCSINAVSLAARIRNGWDAEDAISLPYGSNGGVKRGGPHTPETIEKIRQAAFRQHQRNKTNKETKNDRR